MGWKRRACLTALACVWSVNAMAASPSNAEDLPSVYTVKKGDTLWDISAHFLKQPWLWPSLWQANPEIKNPHLIYPGDQLYLVWVDGQPQLRFKNRKNLAPEMKIQRAPIATLRASVLLPYLSEFLLKAQTDVEAAPKVLGSTDARGQMSVGDRIWVDAPLDVDSSWWIYRPAQTYARELDAKSSASVVTLQEVAQVTVLQRDGDRSEVRLTGVRQEIRQNDVLFPAPSVPTVDNITFAPTLPPEGVNPVVLGHVQDRNYIASSEVVVIDRGAQDAMKAGQIFSLLETGASVKKKRGDYLYTEARKAMHTLGAQALGEVMVIRPFEHFSLAVVLNSKMPFKAGALAVSPESVRADG